MFNLQMAPPHTIEDGIGAAWSKSGAWLRWTFATEGSDVAKDLVNHLFYMVALSIGTITAHLAGLKYMARYFPHVTIPGPFKYPQIEIKMYMVVAVSVTFFFR